MCPLVWWIIKPILARYCVRMSPSRVHLVINIGLLRQCAAKVSKAAHCVDFVAVDEYVRLSIGFAWGRLV